MDHAVEAVNDVEACLIQRQTVQQCGAFICTTARRSLMHVARDMRDMWNEASSASLNGERSVKRAREVGR